MPINSFSPGCFIQAQTNTNLPPTGRAGILTSVEMIPHREEGHVKGHIPHCRIGLEDGDDGNLDEHEEDGVLPRAGQGDRQRSARNQVHRDPTSQTKNTSKGTSGMG